MSVLNDKVYEYLQSIPKGKVVTYKDIAVYLGDKNLARVVGNILHNNPDPNRNPCFRVVNSKGFLAKNFGYKGIDEQKRRLINDGIEVINYRVNLDKYRWKNGGKR